MRRRLLAALLVLMACMGGAAALSAPADAGLLNLGDADCNGKIDSLDAYDILQFDADLQASLPCLENADVDGNAFATAIDAIFVLQYHAGLYDSLPPSGTFLGTVVLLENPEWPNCLGLRTNLVTFHIATIGTSDLNIGQHIVAHGTVLRGAISQCFIGPVLYEDSYERLP